MALGQKRMLNSRVWQNTGFCVLSDKAKLLYLGLITVADDDGRLRANSLLLKSQIFPLEEKITQEEIRKWVNEVKKTGLIDFYRVKNDFFIQHPNWHKYQSIRKDLYKQSNLPLNPLRPSNGRVTASLPSIGKVSINKESKDLALLYLKNIPEKDLDEWYQRFDCSKKALVSKGEQLFNYCKMHGKFYKDYKAMMLNALKKDFSERTQPPQARSKIVEKDGKFFAVMVDDVKNLSEKMKIKD